jgi:hypothetical protein
MIFAPIGTRPHRTMTYSEKLRDPRWQKKRLKIMRYAHWRCQICGAKDSTLHCHHSYYTRGKEPWQYPDGAIICICEGCHEKLHPRPKVDEQPVLPRTPIQMPVVRQKFTALRAAVMGLTREEYEAREAAGTLPKT